MVLGVPICDYRLRVPQLAHRPAHRPQPLGLPHPHRRLPLQGKALGNLIQWTRLNLSRRSAGGLPVGNVARIHGMVLKRKSLHMYMVLAMLFLSIPQCRCRPHRHLHKHLHLNRQCHYLGHHPRRRAVIALQVPILTMLRIISIMAAIITVVTIDTAIMITNTMLTKALQIITAEGPMLSDMVVLRARAGAGDRALIHQLPFLAVEAEAGAEARGHTIFQQPDS